MAKGLLKRSFLLLLVAMLLLNVNVQFMEVQASTTPTINIGTYIQFGKYYGEPILWRVINKDANGDPVLLADRILTLKSFDASGSFHSELYRQAYGSNFYPDSNIRQWLNSSSPNSGGNTLDWIQNDPTAANMWGKFNSYNTEKGFLADENFSSSERNLIKPLTHKVLLAGIDASKRDGGTANHTHDPTLSTVIQDYDSTAYYKNITDSVFLLSVKQLKEWVYDNSASLGTNYHIAKPTDVAVTNSTYKNSTSLNSNSNWHYWLNTPRAGTSENVRIVFYDGSIHSVFAYNDIYGVRPALQLNLAAAVFTSGGAGTSGNPYVVLGSDTSAPTTPTGLNSANLATTSFTLNWTASTDNVGVTGYEIFKNGVKIGTSATNNFTVTGLTQLTAYSFTVLAYDPAGNKSSQSTALSVTTKDGSPPTQPGALTTSNVTSTGLTIHWSASTDNVGVTAYERQVSRAYRCQCVQGCCREQVTGLDDLAILCRWIRPVHHQRESQQEQENHHDYV